MRRSVRPFLDHGEANPRASRQTASRPHLNIARPDTDASPAAANPSAKARKCLCNEAPSARHSSSKNSRNAGYAVQARRTPPSPRGAERDTPGAPNRVSAHPWPRNEAAGASNMLRAEAGWSAGWAQPRCSAPRVRETAARRPPSPVARPQSRRPPSPGQRSPCAPSFPVKRARTRARKQGWP